MPRRCSVCSHPQREQIDQSLLEDQSNRRIATQFSLSEASVRRHRKGHLPASLIKAREAQEVTQADNLLGQLDTLQKAARAILGRALKTNDLRLALGAIREARGNLELLARLLGQLREQALVNIISVEDVRVIINQVVTVVNRHVPDPDTRRAIAASLEKVASLERQP